MNTKKFNNIFSWTGAATIAAVLVAGYFCVTNQALVQRDGQYKALIAEAGEVPFFQVKDFGRSAMGRSIKGYEIGTGTDVLFMFAAIHGNEMGTAGLMNKLVSEVHAHPELLAVSKKLVIIPIANPDGYYDRVDKLNANGVNLNLNFETEDWEHYGSAGTYAGDAPFSESESRAIRELVEKYKPYAMLAFHAKGGLVSPERQDVTKEWSHWYARQTGYEYFDEWDYFGTATRWFTDTTGLPSVTVELSDYLVSDWEINKPALLKLIGSDGTSVPN